MREISQADTPPHLAAKPTRRLPCTTPPARTPTRPCASTCVWSGPARRDESLDPLRFNLTRAPRRAKAGANVSQMHYARRGIITPKWNMWRFGKTCVAVNTWTA